MITITHTRSEGTLVTGTERGDGSAPALRRHRLRWSRNINAWYARQSRGRRANRILLEQLAEDLRAVGFEVEVSIDNSAESASEREERRDERSEERAEALAAKAARKSGEAARASEREHEILDRIPVGQPILVGHHSERRHRRDLARASSAFQRASEAGDDAREAERRAETALRERDRRHTPDRLANKISKLEASERRLHRQLAARDATLRGLRGLGDDTPGDRLELQDRIDRYTAYYADCESELAQVREDLTHFRAEFEDLKQRVRIWTRADFQPGDRVMLRGRWERVIRANPKTISVPFEERPDGSAGWPVKYRYTEVQGKMTAAEWAEQTGQAAA